MHLIVQANLRARYLSSSIAIVVIALGLLARRRWRGFVLREVRGEVAVLEGGFEISEFTLLRGGAGRLEEGTSQGDEVLTGVVDFGLSSTGSSTGDWWRHARRTPFLCGCRRATPRESAGARRPVLGREGRKLVVVVRGGDYVSDGPRQVVTPGGG